MKWGWLQIAIGVALGHLLALTVVLIAIVFGAVSLQSFYNKLHKEMEEKRRAEAKDDDSVRKRIMNDIRDRSTKPRSQRDAAIDEFLEKYPDIPRADAEAIYDLSR